MEPQVDPSFKVAEYIFDTCVSIPFFPKTAKSKLTTKTSDFWKVGWHMCRYNRNMNKYKQPFKVGFVCLQKI